MTDYPILSDDLTNSLDSKKPVGYWYIQDRYYDPETEMMEVEILNIYPADKVGECQHQFELYREKLKEVVRDDPEMTIYFDTYNEFTFGPSRPDFEELTIRYCDNRNHLNSKF